MVIEMKGDAVWSQVEQACNIGPVELISVAVYDDALSFSIVGAVATALEMDVTSCMRAFGRYWVRFAERGSYGAIMDFTGQDLRTFISNLDRMHAAVNLAMPEARTPSFKLVSADEQEIRVRYISERVGLEPLVVGLLEGLLLRFGETGVVHQVAGASSGAEFVIALTRQ